MYKKADNLVTAIDNTFASPVNQNPAEWGIDLVIHSATKYLGGHSDICAGAVAASKEHISQIRVTAINFGGSLDAQSCYLLERSMKTLFMALHQHVTSNVLLPPPDLRPLKYKFVCVH
jgi:cystathionine beta-lyase